MFIEFKNVTFKYPDSDEYVLYDLSFSIEKGNMLTILGHNGSGKSTIAKLIMGLLQPNKGSIYIDGVEITEKSIDSLRVSALPPYTPLAYHKIYNPQCLILGVSRDLRLTPFLKRLPVHSIPLSPPHN